MKNLGVFVLVLGVLVVLGAMMMDVSVPSGIGRVNNIGLMSERQNYILIGGGLGIIGVLMLMIGGSRSGLALEISDSKTCPVCAETIKCAAIRCRYCGADVLVADQGASEQGDSAVAAGAGAEKGGKNSFMEYLILPVVLVVIIFVVILSRV